MSRITSIKKKDKVRNNKHGEVRCATYSIFEEEGTEFFQIDTYGSKDRKHPNQPSQEIQFDRVFAKKLISILEKEFLK
jgi:hypothetical protein